MSMTSAENAELDRLSEASTAAAERGDTLSHEARARIAELEVKAIADANSGR